MNGAREGGGQRDGEGGREGEGVREGKVRSLVAGHAHSLKCAYEREREDERA